MDCSPPGSSIHGVLQAKNTGVGCHFLLQPASLDNQIDHLQANSLLLGLVLGLANEEFDSAECVWPGRKLNILLFCLTKIKADLYQTNLAENDKEALLKNVLYTSRSF